MKNFNLIKRLFMDSHEKQSPQRFARYAAMLIMLLTLGVGQMWADNWICRSTAGGKIATRTVGDKLGGGYDWNYTFTTGGGWSSASDIQVLVGTSTSSYTSVNAGWVSDGDGSNKNVSANIGNVTFDKSGLWYAVGKFYSTYTTTNSTWTNNTTFSMGSNSEPYWQVNPPAVSDFTVTPSGEGYVSGSGTEDDPYIMNCGGGNMTLTLSGSKAHTDANSRLEYKSGSNAWNTTTTRTVNSASATTTAASLTLKMRCYNTSASLSGTESSITIWYKKENSGSVSVSVTPSAGGSASRTPNSMGYYSGGTITATANTGYDFTRWDVTTGSGTIGSATTASTTFKPSTSSANVRATFTAKTINITLDGNGGSNGSATIKYDANALLTKSDASYAGHSLTGYWTASSDGSKVINADGSLNNVAGWVSGGAWKNATDCTLYAQWIEDVTNYSVTYGVKSDQTSLGTLSCATTSGSTPISSGGEVASGTGVTFTASPITGYEVDAWCSDAACTSPIAGAGYANTYATTVSANTTVYVKFKKKIYSITYSPSSAPTGCTYTTKPTTGTYGNTVTMVITPSTGYSVSVSARDASSNVVTVTPGANNQYTFTQPASAVTVTVTATQIMSALTTSCHYDVGNPSYAAPSVSGSATNVGYATTRTITATAAGTGYTFAGWTLTNCTRTDGDAATATQITIRSNGDGAAATVVANYNEDLSSPYTLKGGTNVTGDNWETAHNFTKKTGHSTESVAYCTFNVSSTNSGISGSATDWSFKVLNGETWYGLTADGDSWWYQRNSGQQTLSTSGKNIQLCADVAGPYEIKVDYSTPASPKVTVTFPTSYTLTYSVGSVSGTSGSFTTSPTTASDSKVLSGTKVTLTAPAAKSGYTWKGWYTNAAGTEGNIPDVSRAITVTMNADKTLYACYNETMHTVTVAAGAGGTRSPASVSAGIATKSGNATATANVGYVFTNWTLPVSGVTAAAGYSASSNPIQVNATADSKTITANFAAATAFVEGRFHVTNASRNGTWTNTFSEGNWDENSTRIKFTWDGTNNRYELHTYAQPKELSTEIGGYNPVFYVKESSSSSSLVNEVSYWSATSQTLSTAGTGNKKSLVSSGTFHNDYLRFNSNDESGYAILYFDEAGVWYELEQTLKYDGNGSDGGSAPAGTVYYNKGASATAASNTYTKTGYHFTGWKTAPSSGTSYAEGASVTMNSNITLYAQWEENTYSTTVSAGTGGSVLPSGSVNIGEGAGTSITASPDAGYSFSSWTITGGGISPSSSSTSQQTFTATSAGGSITANFSEVMRTVGVTVNNSYLGSVDAASLTNVGPATKSAAVTATAETGASFTNWTLPSGVTAADGYSTSSNPIMVNATDGSKTITANFTETTYTVSMSTEDGDKGTVDAASASVGQITAVAISATPRSGYMFSKWVKTAGAGTVTYYTGLGNGQVTDASGEEKETTYICVTGNVTLQATWEPDRSSGYVVYYGNDGKNADGEAGHPEMARAWKDGKLYRPTTDPSNTSSFTFTAGVGDVDKVIEFKIHKKTLPEAWYGYGDADGEKIEGNISNATLNTSYGNGRICITMPGSYTFTWNSSNNQLSIAYPTDVYYVRGGWDSWSWSHPMTETSSGVYEATINMTEANHTYTAGSGSGFKVLIAGQYYGKDGTTFTRTSSTGSDEISGCNTSGANLGLTTDYTGNYTFTYNTDGNRLRVTYPTAYKVTYGKGSVDGSASNCSAVDITNGGTAVTSNSTWVKSGNQVVLTAPAAKEGYTYNGWFYNNSGSGVAITTAANCTITVSSAATYYACYTLNNHAITHSAATNGSYTIKVGSLDPVSTNTTADYAQTITLAATPATGYHFGSWTVTKSPSGSVTVTSNQFTMPDADVTVAAAFAANNYTITLNNHDATTAGTTSVSVTYNATTGLTSDITAPEKDGYTFGGYYTAEGGSGTQLITAAGKWQKGNAWINAGGNWVNAGNLELHAKWTANTYTVTFDATTNGGTCATASKSVTFDAAYGELPEATPPGEDAFLGWYTTASGEGSLVTEETIVSNAGDHTLYARFERTYAVAVQFKCGSDVLYPETRVDASQVSTSPTITAPEIFGYAFSGWTESGGSYVTFANASAASTTITTEGAATVVANYTVVPTVYFKNNLGWENVYVTFDAYFDGSRQNAPGSYEKPYFQMTQIGSSDIFYCEIPSTYTASDYASWANNIAFDNTGFDASANVGTKTGAFDSGEFIGRGDFDPRATMFIPYDGDTESRNGGTFFKTGCWIQYNTNYSGYKVHVNSNVQGGGGTSTEVQLRSDIAGSTEFTATVNLTSANYTYGVMLYKDYLKNTSDIWYTNVNDEANTITSATTSLPWAFIPCTDSWQRCRVHTESLGDYKFTVSFATGKPMVDIEYPVTVGDWKLVYKDHATWSGAAHSASWCHPSRVIKAKADAEDIVSFYVAYGSTPSIELHKCTAIDGGTGAQTWEKQGDDLDLSDITATGIYNFKVTQDGSKNVTAAYDGEYEGNFYIRTDASDGGWSNYKTSGTNLMTYSEYAETEHDYTHYYMRFANTNTNIKFVIANDYSECISDTLVDDTYTGEFIAVYGNVRFMWNHKTNTVSRAYISGSTNIPDRFLVLQGDDKLFNESGQALTTAGGGKVSGLNDYEMKFTDDQNWIYETTVKAQPGARIKLTAKYNNKIQYFYGDEGTTAADSVLLIGGSGTDKYKVRVVYDFKTNRLLKAFIPDDTISTDLAIETDLMIIRDQQSDAKQIIFKNSGSLSEVKTVYGAMMFNKWTVNNKERTGGHGNAGLSRYERDLFYISFPFDVKLSDAFGFGTYGKHWIIEYYDGKGRAANGFWADSDPNWKFVMPSQRYDFTMKAFEGYLLALDLDELTESSDVWKNGVENVYIYFPSTAEVENIQATNRLIDIDQDGYECTINRPTPDGDRRVKDSYWHCIGVPSFANYKSDLSETDEGDPIGWSDTNSDSDNDPWTTPSLPYLYTVNWTDKSLSVTTTATFSFRATYSYLVQYAGTSIYWSQVNVTPSAVVARERTAPKNAEFRLELQQAGEKADQTYVRLTDEENVTTGFDFNYDLSKEFNKNRANIYTMVSTMIDGDLSITETAGNTLPMSEQTTVVPVGVKIATTGDYTFAIPEGTNGTGVTLIDTETGVRTSLSALDYTIALEAGTYDNRFVLEISPVQQTPTDVELINGGNGENDVRKVLIDDLLYIVKDGKVYDAQGALVK